MNSSLIDSNSMEISTPMPISRRNVPITLHRLNLFVLAKPSSHHPFHIPQTTMYATMVGLIIYNTKKEIKNFFNKNFFK
jgi:hypothetical protein